MPVESRRPTSLGRLLGVFVLGVLVLAGSGLFAVQYRHQRASEAMTRLAAAAVLLDLARSAQVAFKVQVQEWKNVLLRGQTAEGLAQRTAQFTAQEEAVGRQLEQLAAAEGLTDAMRQEVRSLVAEHRELGTRYRAALTSYVPGEPQSIFVVDAAVRGIDRGLNDRIDALAEDILQTSRRQSEELTQQGEEQYRSLRTFVSSVAAVVILLSAAVAWLALRTVQPRKG